MDGQLSKHGWTTLHTLWTRKDRTGPEHPDLQRLVFKKMHWLKKLSPKTPICNGYVFIRCNCIN